MLKTARESAFHVSCGISALLRCTRTGCYWEGRAGTGGEESFFSGISDSCWPLLRVTPENIACDDADAEKPPFKWRSHLCLQRFAGNPSAGLQYTGHLINESKPTLMHSDAEILCVRVWNCSVRG